MSTLNLKNCKLSNGETIDLHIVDGVIRQIGTVPDSDVEIDIGNKLVMPGAIDTHVHFRDPGSEHKEDWLTGSRAAVAGGVTSVIDMPNNDPPTTNKVALDEKRQRAKKSLVNYGFYLGATTSNADQIYNANNIAGVKIFVGSSTGDLLVSEDKDIAYLLSIEHIKWALHVEDEKIIQKNLAKYADSDDPAHHSKIREPKAAQEALKRIIKIAKKTKAQIHICHVSTKKEIETIKKAKHQGVYITCEVSPHHLFLNESYYEKHGNFVKVNPPLRTVEDNEALMKALNDGTIDIIATDHAPHTNDEKWRSLHQAPSGIPEVQTSLPLMLNEVNRGNITLARLIDVMCYQPAQIYNIDSKGRIQSGYDADLVVIDPDLKKILNKKDLFYKCGWSPYEGRELTGWPIMTFIKGNLVYDNGKINNEFKGKELTYGAI